MTRKTKMQDADYEVGYGKPPKARQFKKGLSGNPRGRPPKSKNMNTLLDEELDRLITLRDGNGVRQISTREAIVKQMIQGALKGDLRQLQFLFRHLKRRNDPEPFRVAAEDEAELKAKLARMMKGGADEDQSV
ncbi:MAG: hypothetical protein JJT95_16325 [Pararhodobacter sp.]|nr:hypothetical protein [Pararhodobacter sp.]